MSYGFVMIKQHLSIAADLTTCETVVYLLFTDSVSEADEGNKIYGCNHTYYGLEGSAALPHSLLALRC